MRMNRGQRVALKLRRIGRESIKIATLVDKVLQLVLITGSLKP